MPWWKPKDECPRNTKKAWEGANTVSYLWACESIALMDTAMTPSSSWRKFNLVWRLISWFSFTQSFSIMSFSLCSPSSCRIPEESEDRCLSHSQVESAPILYPNRLPTRQTRAMSREPDYQLPGKGLFALGTPRGEGSALKCVISSLARLQSISSKAARPHCGAEGSSYTSCSPMVRDWDPASPWTRFLTFGQLI